MNKVYIIAGPNGAGKTTASYTILPEIFDFIAQGSYDEIIVKNEKVWITLKDKYCGN